MIKDFHEFILRDMGTSLAFCDDQEGCGKGREVREGMICIVVTAETNTTL